MKNITKYSLLSLFGVVVIFLCISYFFNLNFIDLGIFNNNKEYNYHPKLSLQNIGQPMYIPERALKDSRNVMGAEIKVGLKNFLALGNKQTVKIENNTSDKIIKESNIEFEVKDFFKVKDSIKTLVKLTNSNIGSENTRNYENDIYCEFYINTPENNFEKLNDKLIELSTYLESQNIRVTNVASDYIDINTRLINFQKLEETYLNLLKSTKSIHDILDIQEKLNDIRAKIESTQGQLNLLNYQLTYYSIHLQIHGKNPNVSKAKVTFWEQFGNSLKNGWENLLGLINVLISLWPFIIILLIILYFVLRHRKRRKVVVDKK